MTINPALFSSATGEWETPQDLFDKLNAEFGFGLDMAATAENAKCPRFVTKGQDALGMAPAFIVALAEHRPIWLNPPYGRRVGRWVQLAADIAQAGVTVVCLLPSRTDTKWFHDICRAEEAEIRFLKGRLHFGGAVSTAPFPSMVVIFHGN